MNGFILGGLCVLASAAFAQVPNCLSHWTWRRPNPQGDSLTGIAYGNGTWVAVGHGGVILKSTNRVDWQVIKYLGTNLHDVVHANGRFVAVGGDFKPLVAASTNGTDWVTHHLSSRVLYGVAYGNGRFVAVGGISCNFPAVAYSDDGFTWQEVSLSASVNFTDIAFGGGRFAAVGFCGSAMISSNGASWSAVTSTNDMSGALLNFIGFADGQFHAEKTVVITEDLQITFDLRWAASDFVNVNGTYVGTQFPEPAVVVSTNGFDWVTNRFDFEYPLRRIATDGTGAVAVGWSGALVTSSNLVDWNIVRRRETNAGMAVFDGEKYVAITADNTALVSSDLENWSRQAMPTDFTLISLIENKRRFVVLGNTAQRVAQIMTSGDGLHWTETLRRSNSVFRSVTAGPDRFVAVGGEGRPIIAVSETGSNWWHTDLNESTASVAVPKVDFSDRGQFIDVAYGDGQYVAVGYQTIGITLYGFMGYSTNGSNWSMGTIGQAGYVHNVAYGNGMFLALDGNFNIYRKPDGARGWQRYSVPELSYAGRLEFIRGVFVALAPNGDDYNRFLCVSTNGSNWVQYPLPTRVQVGSVFFGHRGFLVTGRDGLLLESAPFQVPRLSIAAMNGNSLSISATVEPGFPHRLEWSRNLTDWEVARTFVPSSSPYSWSEARTNEQRYFRIRTDDDGEVSQR